MKKLIKIVLYVFGVILLIGILAAIFTKPSGAANTAAASTDSIHALVKDNSNPPATDGNWKYRADSDKMTSKTNYYAKIDANAQLDLKFPYNGGVTASLVLRYKDGENYVYLNLSKGQFMANTLQPEDIKVRFDTTKALTYSCVGSSDGSSNTIFISSVGTFIEKLKNSKHLIIQAELYDNGIQEMEFETANLKWTN